MNPATAHAQQFIYCPQCGSDNIQPTGETVGDGSSELECMECQVWAGSESELVCKEDDNAKR